jgi:uncharacterized OsmC-like protein
MTTQAATIKADDRFNGLNLQALMQTVGTLQQDRTLARFEFRARNQWLNGCQNRTSIQGFFGAGAEDRSRAKPFVLTHDEPPLLLGDNAGPNPGESLLHALAGCITTTTVMHAAARGIRIDAIATELSGDVDLQGLLDLDPSVPASFLGIKVRMDIQADCSDAELDALLRFVHAHSPVTNSLTRPVPVTIERTRLGPVVT